MRASRTEIPKGETIMRSVFCPCCWSTDLEKICCFPTVKQILLSISNQTLKLARFERLLPSWKPNFKAKKENVIKMHLDFAMEDWGTQKQSLPSGSGAEVSGVRQVDSEEYLSIIPFHKQGARPFCPILTISTPVVTASNAQTHLDVSLPKPQTFSGKFQ